MYSNNSAYLSGYSQVKIGTKVSDAKELLKEYDLELNENFFSVETGDKFVQEMNFSYTDGVVTSVMYEIYNPRDRDYLLKKFRESFDFILIEDVDSVTGELNGYYGKVDKLCVRFSLLGYWIDLYMKGRLCH